MRLSLVIVASIAWTGCGNGGSTGGPELSDLSMLQCSIDCGVPPDLSPPEHKPDLLPPPKPRVLILGTTAAPGALADVKARLDATGAFAAVDTQELITWTTSNVAKLSKYDAVLVFNTMQIPDALTQLGDDLADYYDGGGRVVLAYAANANPPWAIGGRFGAPANGYRLLNPAGGLSGGADSLGKIEEPGSPLVKDVKFLKADIAFMSNGAPVNGAVVVARWSSSMLPLIVRGTVRGRPRVELNLFPPSSSVQATSWSGDGAAIMRNALLYQ